MPWTGPEFRSHHNHGMSPAQATHAAHIANAVLKRSGDEGMAIATANKMGMQPHRAPGGPLSTHVAPVSLQRPLFTEAETQQAARPTVGYLHGTTPGRADAVHTTAPSGSYVMPADVVSASGQGNSAAGALSLQKMLKAGPYGAQVPAMRKGMGIPRRAAGGATETTPVALSHGEFVLTPEEVMQIGDGDLNRGHRILDELVKEIRRRNIKALRTMPGPVGAKK